jgi:hypothetical protein
VFEDTVVHTGLEYSWDASSIPDGHYVLEVEASDELANPEPYILRHTSVSEPFLIDNHAPHLEGLEVRGNRLTERAVDAAGVITRIELSIDGGPWRMFFPSDDLLDTSDERFDIGLPTLDSGSHIVAVRVTDLSGNIGAREITTRE